MKIVVLNGKGMSGKYTFAEQLASLCKTKIYSTIDYIKKIAADYFDWNNVKDFKGRKLLSDLKLASMSYNDKPYNDMVNAILDAQNNNYDLFVCMIRDIPEIEKLCADERFSNTVSTVIVSSDKTKNVDYGNVADDSVFDFIYDYYVYNNGTIQDLHDSAINLIKDLGIE